MEAINLFTKGLKNTIDPLLFDNQSWTFPTMNIRVMNMKGQGFVVTYMEGNTNPDTFYGEEFSITEHFKIVGVCEYNGIAYILSWNENTSIGEIGCFPSPAITGSTTTEAFDTYTPNIVRTYSPLLNYRDNPHSSNRFNTSLFNFDGTIINCFARLDFDDSVNIYMVDYLNTDRVINSGFTQAGKSTGRYYDDVSFQSVTPLQPITQGLATMDLNDVITGGTLKYGNYFIFLRYLTENFDKTAFVIQSRPIQVFQGPLNIETAEGGFFDKYSDKKIRLTLANLDTTYKYYELAYMRYYSDGNSPTQYESALVDKYFLIDELEPEIVDNTNIVVITTSEIISVTNRDITSKAITQNENIAFKANIKSANVHDEALAEFAKRVVPLTYIKELADDLVTDNTSDDVTKMEHKDYRVTYDNVSYFGGETYAFGVVFEFTNGQESDVYPIRGIDNMYNTYITYDMFADLDIPDPLNTAQGENVNGIYRFPERRSGDDTRLYWGGFVRLYGLKLDFTYAENYLNQLTTDATVFLSVKGIKIVRTERKPCLIAQGLAMANATTENDIAHNLITEDCSITGIGHVPIWQSTLGSYNPQTYNDYWDGWSEWWGSALYTVYPTPSVSDEYTTQTTLRLPIYRGYLPKVCTDGSTYSRVYMDRMGLCYSDYAIYSPDVILTGNNIDADSIVYVSSIGKTIGAIDRWHHTDGPQDIPTSSYCFPRYMMAEVNVSYDEPVGTPVKNVTAKWVGNGATNNMPNSNPVSFNGKSYCNEGNDYSDASNHLMYNEDGDARDSNRAFHLLPYIVINVSPEGLVGGDETLSSNMNLDIVNMYKLNPYSITGSSFISFYNVDSLIYHQISNNVIPITITSITDPIVLNITDDTHYGGDCFVQRTYFKQMWNKCSAIELKLDGNQLGCEYTNDNYFDEPSGDNNYNRYYFGWVLGFITENAVNTAMRNSDNTTGRSYYPRNKTSDSAWAIRPYINQHVESFHMNHGFDTTLSAKQWMMYNRYAPVTIEKRPTRIRHSAIHSPGSFIDGYRTWNIDAYKDYDINEGPINALVAFNGTLISVQQNTSNQHYTNQKQQKAEINTGEMIVGIGPILAQDVRKLSFGTIHQNSVKVSENGVYGVDFIKRAIWGMMIQTSQSGSTSIGQINLSKSKEVEGWLYDILEAYNLKTDITRLLEDTPFLQRGIVTGYDPKYKDLYFTFLNPDTSTSNECDVFMIEDLRYHNRETNYYKYEITYYDGMWYWSKVSDNLGHIPTGIEDAYWQPFTQAGIQAVVDGGLYTEGDIIYFNCIDDDLNNAYIVSENVVYNPTAPVENYTSIYSFMDVAIDNDEGTFTVNTFKIKCFCNQSDTIIFNEDRQEFITNTDLSSYMYFNILNDSYSVSSPAIGNPSQGLYGTSRVFRSNQSEVLRFYQKYKEAMHTFIVNGISEKENTQPFTKRFDSMDINSNTYPFSYIVYETDKQGADTAFLTGNFWSEPEYLENKWHVPIVVNTTPSTEFLSDSSIVGHWMKVTIKYEQEVNSYIKQILTNFNISFA